MTRLATHLRLVLAVAAIGVVALGFSWGTATTASGSGGGTALPPGWELCILQGVSAPATQPNVADLDEWQAAEGGSTNNTAAYNPFNTSRTTDVNNTPLPGTVSANGFPAFSNWLAGCAATVATLLQPNMAPITAALRAGNVAPPPAFLATVDQSQWCAPSPDGTPCYADAILGSAGSVATGLLSQSSALTVYANVKSDVQAYQQDVTKVLADRGILTTREQDLTVAEEELASTKVRLAAAQHELQKVAVDEYVSNGLYASGSYVNPGAGSTPFGPPNADGVIAQQYQGIVASDLVARFQSAEAAVKASLAHRADAERAVFVASATLASDNAAEQRSLVLLVADVATMQRAGACTAITVATSSPTATGTGTPAGSPTTVTTTPPAGPSSTIPQASTTTTVPSTTTTTVPSTTTTTTLPSNTPSVVPTSSTTTTTTTQPKSTTTQPKSTTTTTTTTPDAPSSPAAGTPAAGTPAAGTPAAGTPQTANPAGLAALQGCMAVMAPPPPS